MKYFTKEVKIGLAGIVALFMLIYGLNYLKGVDIFKPSKYIYVKFSDINGLTKSSPVYANGFKVGIVSDIVYDNLHPGNIAVEVELEQDIVLPKGTSAELQAEMLGGVRMNLLFAENKGDFYAIGDTLQGANNAGLMGDLSTELMPKIVMMMPKLDSILVSLNAILADKSIPSTLSSLDATMKNLERSSASLSVLLDKDDENSLIPSIDPEYFEKLKADGTVADGMLPKLENAFKAIAAGVGKVTIKNSCNIANDRQTVLLGK